MDPDGFTLASATSPSDTFICNSLPAKKYCWHMGRTNGHPSPINKLQQHSNWGTAQHAHLSRKLSTKLLGVV